MDANLVTFGAGGHLTPPSRTPLRWPIRCSGPWTARSAGGGRCGPGCAGPGTPGSTTWWSGGIRRARRSAGRRRGDGAASMWRLPSRTAVPTVNPQTPAFPSAVIPRPGRRCPPPGRAAPTAWPVLRRRPKPQCRRRPSSTLRWPSTRPGDGQCSTGAPSSPLVTAQRMVRVVPVRSGSSAAD